MGQKTAPKTAIVIGAGIGGVGTAARLAKAGLKVTVVEKNDFSGGRCSLIHHDGWRFDQGPSLLLLPNFFRQAFHDLGTTLEDEGVHIVKCDPNYNIWFGDGESFRMSTDVAAMKEEIEKWEGKDGFSRYLAFMREAHEHYELSATHVLLRNFTSILSMTRWSFLKHLLALHPFESIYSRAARYFRTERLRRVFTFGSMYMGMNPFEAPGTYSLLQYTELAEGIWYPLGGFHKVVEALVNVGERLGVKYRFSTAVEKITMSADKSRATGVLLANGEHLTADIIINNSDLVYAYNNLLPPTPYANNLTQREGSCSSISFYWALDRKIPQLSAHNVFLADEYKESFDAIFKRHLIPNEPSFYVNVPSRVDPSAAPPDKEAIVILVPVGNMLDSGDDKPAPTGTENKIATGQQAANGDPTLLTKDPQKPGLSPSNTQDWEAMVALARRTILATIKARTGIDLAPHIVFESSNDPKTWHDRFNLDRGAILGLSHSFFNVLSFRPSTRARRGGFLDGKFGGGILGRVAEVLWPGGSIEGLYMVGASTHPGTGMPIVLAGSKLVSEQILEDLGIEFPWRDAWTEGDERMVGKAGRTGHAIDTVEEPPVWTTELVVQLLLAVVVLVVLYLLMAQVRLSLRFG